MGHYRVTVVGLGGHGCQRERGDKEAVLGCNRPNCPDCITREYVRRLMRTGEQVQVAQIEHWPADLGYSAGQQVVDDLVSGVRTGSFPERDAELRRITLPLACIYETPDGQRQPMALTVSGGTTVESIIQSVRGKTGRKVAGWGDYDLAFDDGAWRLGKPSCFPLSMEARHLPKGKPETVVVYRNEYIKDVPPA